MAMATASDGASGGGGDGLRQRSAASEEEDEETERWGGGGGIMVGKPVVVMVCGGLVYYHCAHRNTALLSLASDVLIVLLSSLAILGMLFRQMNIAVPVDPLEWQLSPDTANCFAACVANTIGAAESVLRVAASGHDKRLFFKVVVILYVLSSLGRLASGATVAFAGLCLFCLYMFVQNSEVISKVISKRRASSGGPQETT